MDSNHEEDLREEMLSFVDEVRETFLRNNDYEKWDQFRAAVKLFHDNFMTSNVLLMNLKHLVEGYENLLASNQKLILDKLRPQTQTQIPAKSPRHEKGGKFLERLRSENEDIYRQVTSALTAHHKGQLGKCQLYVKICALLNGRPRLFHLYESTLIDGSEESYQSVVIMRQLAKQDCLRDVDTLLKDYKDTIMAIERSPESLTQLHLRCAANMYSDVDEEMRNKRMRDLAKNPKKLRVGAMPRLERKVTLLQDAKEKLFKYFTQIESYPI